MIICVCADGLTQQNCSGARSRTVAITITVYGSLFSVQRSVLTFVGSPLREPVI